MDKSGIAPMMVEHPEPYLDIIQWKCIHTYIHTYIHTNLDSAKIVERIWGAYRFSFSNHDQYFYFLLQNYFENSVIFYFYLSTFFSGISYLSNKIPPKLLLLLKYARWTLCTTLDNRRHNEQVHILKNYHINYQDLHGKASNIFRHNICVTK